MRGLLFHSCVKLTCDPSCVLHESSPLHYFQNVQHFIVQHASSTVGQPHDTDIISTRNPLLQPSMLDDVTDILLLVKVLEQRAY